MQKTKEILITTETREVIVVRRQKIKNVKYFCPDCRAKSEMVSVSKAVADYNFEIREIVESVQSKKLHLLVTKNNQHLLCSNSLAQLNGEANKLEN